MFQTVRHFQSKSVKGGSAGTTKSFREGSRQEPAAAMGAGASVSNDSEQLNFWASTKEHVKRELWSYVGLVGVFCVYFGILVCVYALKGVFAQRWVMTIFGVFLTGVGGVNLFVSWMCYRCQKKHRRFSCFGDSDGDDQDPDPPPLKEPGEKSRPRGHSLAGFLTPEFAKYAEFSARDRRYDSKRYHFFKAYDPTQISISFAHKYWLEQQKPLLQTAVGNPSIFPSSVPTSPHRLRATQSSETRRKLLDVDGIGTRRQVST